MHNSRILMSIFLGLVLLMVWAGATETGSFPVPVQTIQPPDNLSVAVQVDQEGSHIIATYRGGFGQMLLKEIQMELVKPDGTSEKKMLGKKVGDSVTFTGTGCGDQILGYASYMNGITYPFLNQMGRNIPGICAVDNSVVTDPCAVIAASPSMKTEPVTEIPGNKSISIQANVDIQTINVEFRGGFGQGLVKSLTITQYGPDGTSNTKELENRVGATASFNATNNCMDRITADVIFMDGTLYHFFDQVLYISRNH